jgi:eukaryotic-like serine/threonine-protein kinase
LIRQQIESKGLRGGQGLFQQPAKPVTVATLTKHMPGVQDDVVALICACLRVDASKRPSMADVQAQLARHLLQNRHRALVVMNGQPHSLDRRNRKIVLNAGSVGAITIEYDGFDFKVVDISGAVYLNNKSANIGNVVPGCCVITFGGCQARVFVTFDVSHPEVMP